jgi:type I restriction enzyme S subunit
MIPYSQKCGIPNLTPYQVSGVNKDKEFFEPSHQVGEDTSKYQIVPPRHFACNLMHVGRDRVLPIAYNHSEHEKVVSPAYTVFSLKESCGVLDDYFFIMLKCEEQDRYFWFHADASVRDGMSWSDFCDVEITVPDIPTQQKYVDIYKAMVANQQSYERGLEDLKLTFEGYMDTLRNQHIPKPIGEYLELVETTNEGLQYGVDDVMGISIEKKFIPTKADMMGVNLKPYYVIQPNEFAYVTVTSRNGEKISIALNDSDDAYICSSSYVVFKSKDIEQLWPQYLMLYFARSEFNRYARFCSWGSARETFDWSEMQLVEIPIPDIKLQKAIASVLNVYIDRKRINEHLKAQIKDICPILIRGSLEEGK